MCVIVFKQFYFRFYVSRCIEWNNDNKNIKLCNEKNRMSKIMNNIVDYINDDESMFDELFTKDEYEFVRKVVDELSSRESYIIKMYFGFNGKTYTQVEISKILGLSQSHISKIIKKTLEDITLKLVQFEYADKKYLKTK